MHGDIHNANIIVKSSSGFDDGFFLGVDYDFCGKIKEVRYPLHLNTSGEFKLKPQVNDVGDHTRGRYFFWRVFLRIYMCKKWRWNP